VQNNQKGCF